MIIEIDSNSIRSKSVINPYKYFYMLMMFLWTAKTTPLLAVYSTEVKSMAIIHLFIIIFYYIKYCRKANFKPLKIIFSVFLLWYIAFCFKYGGIQPIYTGIIYNSIIAFIAFYVYKGNEFYYYFNMVLTHLCIISLFVWICAIIFPSIIPQLLKSISIYENNATLHSNIFIVGLSNQFDYVGIRRNLGFTWEAGRFSCYIVLGIFIYLTIHDFKLKNIFRHNKQLIIYIITLFSTLSTTGVAAFLFVLFYYIYNRKTSSKLFLIIIFLFSIPTIWSLSFISDKIINNIDITQEIANMTYSFDHGKTAITPQRITGLYLEFLNFINDFWLGYGINENSFIHRDIFKFNTVWLSNGILQIFSMYGIIVGLTFYLLLFKSSKLITLEFGKKGVFFFAFTFILISISYDFWANCICLFFIYQYIFKKYNSKLNQYV